MPIPLNPIAETIAKLRAEVESTTANISFQQQQISLAEATITSLEPLAEWGPEEPVVEAIS